MKSRPQRPHLTEADIVGAWECFEGDGIHGWNRHALVVGRVDGRFTLEWWFPNKGRPGWRSTGCPRVYSIVATTVGLRLTSERDAYDVWGEAADGTIWAHLANTTAGLAHYRRVDWPIGRGT